MTMVMMKISLPYHTVKMKMTAVTMIKMLPMMMTRRMMTRMMMMMMMNNIMDFERERESKGAKPVRHL